MNTSGWAAWSVRSNLDALESHLTGRIMLSVIAVVLFVSGVGIVAGA